jgi:hypothetical protein
LPYIRGEITILGKIDKKLDLALAYFEKYNYVLQKNALAQ